MHLGAMPENVLTSMVRVLEDLRRWTPSRVASHTPYGVVELMPITDGELYAFKYVNGHPLNPARGLQTVTAFGALADMDNGYPIFFADDAADRAAHRGAVRRADARPLRAPGVHALIGAGESQAEFQALAFRRCRGSISCGCSMWDESAVEKVRRNLEPLGFAVHLAEFSLTRRSRGPT